jgi:hypothetical protein
MLLNVLGVALGFVGVAFVASNVAFVETVLSITLDGEKYQIPIATNITMTIPPIIVFRFIN